MNESQKLLKQMTDDSVQISYTGAFDGQILSVIAKNIEYTLSHDPKVNKKVFKIFLELAQNISYYSAEQMRCKRDETAGVGTLTIQEFDSHFVFATGNMVENKIAKKINEKCERINKLTRDDLRQFKRDQRKLPAGVKGGGNIGLIQVALTAGNPLNFKMLSIDDKLSFFIVAVKIDKQNRKR